MQILRERAKDMNWTKEQREAIEYRGENILLAAAAGSGKTAVLVQRIIELISPFNPDGSEKENPVCIDELLVLTFTEAAAREMRGKILAAVNRALDENPHNEHLLRQSVLINTANISTVHSFCLNIIKENIYMADLPVDFTLVSETENIIMQKDALGNVLERFYKRIDSDSAFKSLVLGYGGIKNDETLRKTVLSLMNYARSMPYPKKWLCEAVREYRRAAVSGSLENSIWRKQQAEAVAAFKNEILELYDAILYEIESSLFPEHPYAEFFSAEARAVRDFFAGIEGFCKNSEKYGKSLEFGNNSESENNTENGKSAEKYNGIENSGSENYDESLEIGNNSGGGSPENSGNDKRGCSYDGVREKILAFSFPTIAKGIRAKDADSETAAAQERIKNIRQRIKDAVGELKEIFETQDGEVLRRIKETYPIVRTLKNIVIITERRYTRQKRQKKLLDFGDLEHEALRLLADRHGRPTEAAQKLNKKFKEILLDEYQDTNNIQEAIFKTISASSGNIFMVGDIKQCIYKFRNAVPKLFSDKYYAYQKPSGGGHLIRLFRNFRSRQGVINTVNFVFGAIMSLETGELDYTEDEYLVKGAQYREDLPKESFKTEFHMLCSTDGQSGETTDSAENEARLAAKRINEITAGEITVFDKEQNAYRKAEFRDIVILMRNTKSNAPIFERVLSENNIPVYTDAGRSYLGSVEIATVMAILQTIDNPLQDIPLIAALRSPVFSFTPEELASIRAKKRSGSYFSAVCEAAGNGNGKAADFLAALESLRSRAEHTGVDGIIRSIYHEYGYYAYVGSMSQGEVRQANLTLLFERAAEFEKSGLSGLFRFVKHIETIISEKNDLSPAKVFGEEENVVRVMSIHKSKGLEFPVVILADTAHRFNTRDLDSPVLWHETAGLGIDYVDSDLRAKYPSASRTLLRRQAKRELIAEEMRLLYVALTRAREKLIITASFKENESGWKKAAFCGKKAAENSVRKAMCYRDWLAAAFMQHPCAGELREICGQSDLCVRADSDFDLSVNIYQSAEDCPAADIPRSDLQGAECAEPSDELRKSVFERLGYNYKNEDLGNIPVKMSVSEVKRMESESGEGAPLLESLRVETLGSLSEYRGAARGTIVHFALQYLDLKRTNSEEEVAAQLDEMQQSGIITEAQRRAVSQSDLFKFFESSIGKRLKNADYVEKEYSFYTQATADELLKNGAEETVLLQGTIDCFFTEGENLVLLDYKTDNVKSRSEALERAKNYKTQMKYYQRGLSGVLGRKVCECYLYFLNCGEAVPVEIFE